MHSVAPFFVHIADHMRKELLFFVHVLKNRAALRRQWVFCVPGTVACLFTVSEHCVLSNKINSMAVIREIQDNGASGLAFSTHLQELWIDGASNSVIFLIALGGITIFSAEYVPDGNGEIRLYNLRRILESHIDGVFADFVFTVKESGKSEHSVSYRVFKTAVRVSECAEEFLPSFFLTTLINRKLTQLGRYETLSFYPQSACSVYALASYYTESGIDTKEVSLMSEQDVVLNVVNSVNVSPSRFVDDSMGELIGYVVRAGERSFSFEIDSTQAKADPALLFLNNFGCWETMYLTGTIETEYEIKRSHAYIDGRFRQYDLDDTEYFKANSGVLLDSMLRLGMDLARSKSIFLLDSMGVADDEIVLSDSEIKYANDDDSMPSFDYTYRRASFVPGMLHTIRPPKLFDKTFDVTFN